MNKEVTFNLETSGGGREVAGSNPVAPTRKEALIETSMLLSFLHTPTLPTHQQWMIGKSLAGDSTIPRDVFKISRDENLFSRQRF